MSVFLYVSYFLFFSLILWLVLVILHWNIRLIRMISVFLSFVSFLFCVPVIFFSDHLYFSNNILLSLRYIRNTYLLHKINPTTVRSPLKRTGRPLCYHYIHPAVLRGRTPRYTTNFISSGILSFLPWFFSLLLLSLQMGYPCCLLWIPRGVPCVPRRGRI